MSNVILLEQFKNKPIRIVRRSKEVMVPLNDIADAIEYDRKSLRNIIDRNNEVFKHFKGRVIMTSPGGSQETICLSRDGVLGLLMKLDYHRIKDETKKQLIIDFQVWAIETLGQVIDGNITETKLEPWVEAAEQHIRFAKILAESTGIKPGIAYAAAINEAEKEIGRPLDNYRKLIPAAEHDTGYLTAGEVAKKVGMSTIKLNKRLAQLGLQEQQIDTKGRKNWRLTQEGKEYGEEFPFVRNGHSGYQIKWNESILTMLSDDYIEEFQR
jgi:hypothetical protein